MVDLDDLLPRDLAIEGGARYDKVLKITEDELSFFKGKTMKDVFMYAMGLGFKNKNRVKLGSRKPNIPTSPFKREEVGVILAIAIKEMGGLGILSGEKKKQISEIAEEYANGGIDLLYSLVFDQSAGSNDKKMEQDLLDVLNVQK